MILLFFLIIGCITGFLAGLLGIGGGSLIVPVIIYSAEVLDVPNAIIMKMALGTSFAIIILSTASSAYAHHKRGSILWKQMPLLAIGSAIGVIIGSLLVNRLSNTLLQIIFCLFLAYTIYSLLCSKKNGDSENQAPKLSSKILAIFGLIIGFASSFVGIAGGSITVPLLTKSGYEIRKSIATSSSIGVILSLFGTITYIASGWNNPDLPPFSFGYVYLPAFFGIATTSIFVAPLGVKLAYRLPVQKIRIVFALFLVFVLLRMIYTLIS